MRMYEESVSPVVGAVLVEIGDGHGAVRELVDEERLEQSLGVVKHPGDHSKTSLLSHVLRRGSIDETGLHAENEHDDQGSGVFEDEHLGSSESNNKYIAVANLRTNIAQNDMSVHLDLVVRNGLLVVRQTERLLLGDHDLESLTHLDQMHYE